MERLIAVGDVDLHLRSDQSDARHQQGLGSTLGPCSKPHAFLWLHATASNLRLFMNVVTQRGCLNPPVRPVQ